MARSRRQRRVGAAIAISLVVVAALVVTTRRHHTPKPAALPCLVTSGTASYGLDLAQAANATTIAGVGKRLGMPDHAVTVALSAALLESQLHNLAHGDRDSVGLFQQRPSQGWGTPAQLHTPHYAAAAFYRGLARVPGWQVLPVTVAAQRVQRSALPNGYAREEGRARALASALTGEVPTGLTCRVAVPSTPALASLTTAIGFELGAPSIGVDVSAARGWTVANWMVAHAVEYRITDVRFGGMRWTPQRGTWRADATASLRVEIDRTVRSLAAGGRALPRSGRRGP